MTIGDYQRLKPGDKIVWIGNDTGWVLPGTFEVIRRLEPCSVLMPDYEIFNPKYPAHNSAHSNLNWEIVK